MQRTARPAFARVREVLEAWFQAFPAEHKVEIRSRIISGNDRHFLSATFELYVYTLIKRMGADLLVHPEVDGASTRPDFLVTPRRGEPYYLEATVATDVSDEQLAANARINAVYDAIDRMESPNFFIGVRHHGSPSSPVPARRIRAFLLAQLAELDPAAFDSWAGKSEGFDSLPHWHFSHDGWDIDFFAIPKAPEHRGLDGSRPLGMFMPRQAAWIDSRGPLRDAIVDKAGRYGALDYAFVIAVNVLGWPVERISVMQSLFGREQVVSTRGESEDSWRMERLPDGAWISSAGPRNQRVSAAIVADRIYPWSVAAFNLCVYHNPWAIRPLHDQLDLLPSARPDAQQMQWRDGVEPRELLGLPVGWPD
jgi:hypothetical protein